MSGDEPQRGSVKPLTEQEVSMLVATAKTLSKMKDAKGEVATGGILAHLVATVEQLQQRLAEAEQRLADTETMMDDYVRRAVGAERKLAQARDALEFYAQQYCLGFSIASDGGQKARDALAALEPDAGS